MKLNDWEDSHANRRRAYEHFQARGGEHGRDQKDRLAAERELSKKERE